MATSRGKFHRVQLLVPMQMVRAIDRMINGCTRMAVEKNEYIEYGMPDGSTMATTILGSEQVALQVLKPLFGVSPSDGGMGSSEQIQLLQAQIEGLEAGLNNVQEEVAAVNSGVADVASGQRAQDQRFGGFADRLYSDM